MSLGSENLEDVRMELLGNWDVKEKIIDVCCKRWQLQGIKGKSICDSLRSVCVLVNVWYRYIYENFNGDRDREVDQFFFCLLSYGELLIILGYFGKVLLGVGVDIVYQGDKIDNYGVGF